MTQKVSTKVTTQRRNREFDNKLVSKGCLVKLFGETQVFEMRADQYFNFKYCYLLVSQNAVALSY